MAADTTLDANQIAARRLREATKNKAYRAYPIGGEIAHYLRWKRGSITDETYRSYEGWGDKFARHFLDLELSDFEPPVGTERLEEFFDLMWGDAAPNTYNRNLATARDFFKWAVLKDKLHGDPTLPMLKRRRRATQREAWSEAVVERILAKGPRPDQIYRDRCLLRLVLHYGLRKGTIMRVQDMHFDDSRRRLTCFVKGDKVQTIVIPEQAFWNDLDLWRLEEQVKPEHYLLCRHKKIFWKYDEKGEKLFRHFQYGDDPLSTKGAHLWWYGCLQRAGIVDEGVTKGKRMHWGRHTAGQLILDKTKGDLKAVQKTLGHSSMNTTADSYVDYDLDKQEEILRGVYGE